MVEDASRIALVAGASGLVGSKLLPRLLDASEYGRVYALTRRPLLVDNPRLANRVVRFDTPLETQLQGMRCHDAYCCLGTTLRTAGSRSAFRAVDHDAVLAFARFALAAGAERLVIVSSVGAEATSKNFYLQVKGETEQALQALRFRALDLLAPSLLLGTRRHVRPLEAVAQATLWTVSPLLLGTWLRYRPVTADTVAAAMLGAARGGRVGLHRYTYEGIRALSAPPKRQNIRL
jgi:uncharacterized protein YbjT (DUF2867 family)